MKKILFALLVSLSLAAGAQNATAQRCAKLGELASSVMEARQGGVPFTKMIELAEGNKLVEAIVVEAFKIPRYSSEPYQRKAISDFVEKVEVTCYSSLKGTV